MMASNPNTGLDNLNTIYLACSGGGKSQALRQNPAIPRKGARVLLWDIDHDHPCTRFESMPAFIRAVSAGVKSKKGFRIGYSGADSVEAFEVFNQVVWAVLDGRVKTHVVIEELADVSPSSGKALPHFGRLLRKGRKYGAELHLTSQRSAEIPKTAYSQTTIKIIGMQDSETDVKRMSRVAGVSEREIREIQPLNYLVKKTGEITPEKLAIKYKK